uniref:Uncharacterized protein LOC100375086 n=1 Tax=Saccoglossus kowalevskii TaxID=10224 RepID=A0ABM0MK40_SACKO|nr:PREDICTED: uncharacterized protein LOC100375086 [Saccoglossus kowalevskii]
MLKFSRRALYSFHTVDQQESIAASDGELPVPLPVPLSRSSSLRSVGSMCVQNDDIGHVASWAVGFERLLYDPLGLACFTEFLKKEFSEENIAFWIACEKYKKLTDAQEMKACARDIYNKHLSKKANMPVNLDSQARQEVEAQLENPTPTLYNMQQKQGFMSKIFQLMKFDSYSRFLKSDLYRECMKAELEGKSLPIPPPKEWADSATDDSSVRDGKEDVKSNKKGEKKKKEKSKKSKESKSGDSSLDTTDENIGEKRRKSFMPWHRNKTGKKATKSSSFEKKEKKEDKSNVVKTEGSLTASTGSRRSSLASCDLQRFSSDVSESLERTSSTGSSEIKEPHKFCRVILPDNSTTVIAAKEGQSVRAALKLLCERRRIAVASMEVYDVKTNHMYNLHDDLSTLASKEVVVENRVMFKVELPSTNKRTIGVKSKPNKAIIDVLRPIMNKYNLSLDGMVVHLNASPVPLELDIEVATLEGQRVIIEPYAQYAAGRISMGRPPVPKNGRIRKADSVDNSLDESNVHVVHMRPAKSHKYGGVASVVESRVWWSRECGGVVSVVESRVWWSRECGGVACVVESRVWWSRECGGVASVVESRVWWSRECGGVASVVESRVWWSRECGGVASVVESRVWWSRECGGVASVVESRVWWSRECGGVASVVESRVWWSRECGGVASVVESRVWWSRECGGVACVVESRVWWSRECGGVACVVESRVWWSRECGGVASVVESRVWWSRECGGVASVVESRVWWSRECGGVASVVESRVWWSRECGGVASVVESRVWWSRECDLFDLVARAQRNRMDDQRGMTPNLELPEFLRVQANARNAPGSRLKRSPPVCKGNAANQWQPKSASDSENVDEVNPKMSTASRCEVYYPPRPHSTPPIRQIQSNDLSFRDGILPTHHEAEFAFGGWSGISTPKFDDSEILGLSYREDNPQMELSYRAKEKYANFGNVTLTKSKSLSQNREDLSRLSPSVFNRDQINRNSPVVRFDIKDEAENMLNTTVIESTRSGQPDRTEHNLDIDDLDTTITASMPPPSPPSPSEVNRTYEWEEANYSPPPPLTSQEREALMNASSRTKASGPPKCAPPLPPKPNLASRTDKTQLQQRQQHARQFPHHHMHHPQQRPNALPVNSPPESDKSNESECSSVSPTSIPSPSTHDLFVSSPSPTDKPGTNKTIPSNSTMFKQPTELHKEDEDKLSLGRSILGDQYGSILKNCKSRSRSGISMPSDNDSIVQLGKEGEKLRITFV